MIVLFTDFGLNGPYVGQIKAALAAGAPGVPVVDLMHDAPVHNPRAAAYLLASLTRSFPRHAVFCAVVDPGVGGARAPVYLEADGQKFVGPGNGLFEIVGRRARKIRVRKLALSPDPISATFHGRDLFAPAAALLARGEPLPVSPVDETLPGHDWPHDLAEVIYIDSFGNGMTGLRAETLSPSATLSVGGRVLVRKRTFSDVSPGDAVCFENSNGLLEIAVNRSRAVDRLNLEIGTPVAIDGG